MGKEAIEVDFDSEISGETDILVPREPGGVSPVMVTVVVTVGTMEWSVLRLEIPVSWVILLWVGDILEPV